MQMTNDAMTKCEICHRSAEVKDLTTAVFLVAGVEETRHAHQKCLDKKRAAFERWNRKAMREHARQQRP
jgi:hypothetical protein